MARREKGRTKSDEHSVDQFALDLRVETEPSIVSGRNMTGTDPVPAAPITGTDPVPVD
jgi:hypothetical protein